MFLCVHVEILNTAARFPPALELRELLSDVGHVSHHWCVVVSLRLLL